MGDLPWGLEGLPCPVCGGTSLARFPWVLGYGLTWSRHTWCPGCEDFGEEFYDGEDGTTWLAPTARTSLSIERLDVEEVEG